MPFYFTDSRDFLSMVLTKVLWSAPLYPMLSAIANEYWCIVRNSFSVRESAKKNDAGLHISSVGYECEVWKADYCQHVEMFK